jgi:hypothetical protein
MAKYQHVQQYCNDTEIEFQGEPTDIQSAFNEAARENAKDWLTEFECGVQSGIHEVQLAADEAKK